MYVHTRIASIPRWRPNPYAREDADFALQNIRQTMRPFSTSDCGFGNGRWGGDELPKFFEYGVLNTPMNSQGQERAMSKSG